MRFVPKKGEDQLYLIAGSIMIGWSFSILITNFYYGTRFLFIFISFICSFVGLFLIMYVHLTLNPIIPNTFTGLLIRLLPGLMTGVGVGFLQANGLLGGSITIEGIFLITFALFIGLITVLYSLDPKEFIYSMKKYLANKSNK